MNQKLFHLYTAGIILLTLSLGIFRLGYESLWFDEIFTFIKSNVTFPTLIHQIKEGELESPVYFVALFLWIKTIGSSAEALRMFSVLCGAGTVFVVIRLMKMLFDEKTALTAGLLLAVSVYHLQYMQEVRGYALFGLLAALSMFTFIKALYLGRKRDYGIYFCVTGFYLGAHLYAFLLVLTQFFFAFYLRGRHGGRDVKRVMALQISQMIYIIPLGLWAMVILLEKYHRGGGWSEAPTIKTLVWSLVEWSGSWPSFVCFAGLIGAGVVYGRRPAKTDHLPLTSGFPLSDKERIKFLWAWMAVPLMVPFFVGLVHSGLYLTRYAFPGLIGFMALAAVALRAVRVLLVRRALYVLLIVLAVFNLKIYYVEINNEPWRESVRYIEEQAVEGDGIVVHAPFCRLAIDHYLTNTRLPVRPFPIFHTDLHYVNMTELYPIVRPFPRFWLVLSHSRDRENLILKELLKRYRVVDQKEFRRLDRSTTLKGLRPEETAIVVFLFEK